MDKGINNIVKQNKTKKKQKQKTKQKKTTTTKQLKNWIAAHFNDFFYKSTLQCLIKIYQIRHMPASQKPS